MKPQNRTLHKIGFASFIMMLSVFSSRVIGLVREMTIAFVGGARGEVDAYQIAFIIPEILNHVVASGFLSVTFIPIFSHYLTNNNEEEGWRVFSIIFNTFGILLLIFISVAFYYSPELVMFFAPGFKDPELFKSAVRMTRIIMPAQFFFFAGGMFMAVQFTKEKFFIPALAPLLYNLGIILGGLTGLIIKSGIGILWLNNFLSKLGIDGFTLNIGIDRYGSGMEGFAWGVFFGAFAGNFVLQYFGAKKIGMKIYPLVKIKHPEFIKYLLLTIPLMVGLSMSFSTEILLKYFGSFLSDGSIAALNYALRIMFILVGIFGQAVGVASYPFMAKLASLGKIDELNELLNTTLKYLLLVIPISALFIVLRHEIVFLLFQRGKFNLDATKLTSEVLPFIMAGTFAFAAQTVVVRGYYAIQNTWFPALFGTIAVFASLPLFFILTKWMGASGVGLALSLSAFMNSGFLFALWNKRSSNRGAYSVYLFMLKVTIISCGIGLILWKVTLLLQTILQNLNIGNISINNSTILGALLISAIIALLFVALFVLSGLFFKIEEITIFANKVRAKISVVFRKISKTN
ncbi:MAG: murein biosynthesis integral membrane protein MurJ [Desulfamplus sp.]|nr:murein biosynthesis integral membrane protein MurJ [Desulfamplus sp.]